MHACTLDYLPGEFLFLFHIYFDLEILDPEFWGELVFLCQKTTVKYSYFTKLHVLRVELMQF